MTTLILVTGSYPYSVAAESTFLPQELDELRRHFDRIVLLPESNQGSRDVVSFEGVSVDDSYAIFARSRFRRAAYALRALVHPVFLRECRDCLRHHPRSPGTMVRALRYHVRARLAEDFIGGLWASGRLTYDDRVVLYTWWFDAPALGMSTFASRAGIRLVTRAHGYDLYETRFQPAYIPFRPRAMAQVSAVFADSEAGAAYMRARFPEHAGKILTGLLGVPDPGFENQPSLDGVFRILSCSFMVPVKRLDLLAHGIAQLGRENPDARFSWTHIGDGPTRPAVEAIARTFPGNVRADLMRYPGADAVRAYYREEPVDVFVNVSRSEGTSVAIMEAISVGIPVIGTSVGGNTEIIGPENGVLIAANPSPGDVAAALGSLRLDRARAERLRRGSRERWRERYDAARTYAAFAETVRGLAGQPRERENAAR